MAALVLFAAAATPAPPAARAGHGITAEQAMANYRAKTSAAIADTPAEACPEGASDQIIVCGKRQRPRPRLPLPDERAEAGEAVRHPGEPASVTDLSPDALHCRLACEPSKFGETLAKGIHLLKSAITGEDPTD